MCSSVVLKHVSVTPPNLPNAKVIAQFSGKISVPTSSETRCFYALHINEKPKISYHSLSLTLIFLHGNIKLLGLWDAVFMLWLKCSFRSSMAPPYDLTCIRATHPSDMAVYVWVTIGWISSLFFPLWELFNPHDNKWYKWLRGRRLFPLYFPEALQAEGLPHQASLWQLRNVWWFSFFTVGGRTGLSEVRVYQDTFHWLVLKICSWVSCNEPHMLGCSRVWRNTINLCNHRARKKVIFATLLFFSLSYQENTPWFSFGLIFSYTV